MTIASIDPTTGETLKVFPPLAAPELEARLGRAAAAFGEWRRAPFGERAALLDRVADVLDAEAGPLAATMTQEMGKPLAQARAEVTKCATAFRYYARHGAAFLADEPGDAPAVKARRAFVRYQPLGPVLAVMPWNFPLWQVTRFAAPALMAGNVGLLKHASNVPQTALAFEETFTKAGAPPGVFQTLLIESGGVQAVLNDARVAAATLTGSEAAGSAVAAAAGRRIRKTVLELGGSDPFVVLASADLEGAVAQGVWARCQNNGQSCIAAKRFIVHEAVADEFERRFVEAMAAQVVGDPMHPATAIGPLATRAGREVVDAQVQDALGKGATPLCGGEVPDGAGWFYPPTVLSGITPAMRVYREEVFGPVAQLYRVASAREALDLANATEFGLGSNVWTNDPAEQELFIDGFAAGQVFVNGFTTSYPELPFGGIKASGYGRELGRAGIREFCNAKTVWVGP
ncbi:MAG TPA: aldehyde dehydrogenase family protein [Actinomycetota bacterium]|nr:aldehyde dehydrogenase family protein [Actinomycetota bacterium]